MMSPRPNTTLVDYGGVVEGVVRMVLERGDVKGAPSRTPTSYASESRHEEVVKFLGLPEEAIVSVV